MCMSGGGTGERGGIGQGRAWALFSGGSDRRDTFLVEDGGASACAATAMSRAAYLGWRLSAASLIKHGHRQCPLGVYLHLNEARQLLGP